VRTDRLVHSGFFSILNGIFFGNRVLGIVFGSAFIPAHRALEILCVEQLFSASS
jgi:hypothetical protein